MEKGKSATNQEVLTVHVDNNMGIVGSNMTQEPARENVTTERYVRHSKIYWNTCSQRKYHGRETNFVIKWIKVYSAIIVKILFEK